MKNILFILLAVYSINSSAQNRHTKNGHIRFFSEAPLENIEPHNHKVGGILDMAKNEVAISLLIESFKFDKPLIEEHFNENCLESDKFPKASFIGNFQSKELIDTNKNGTYPVAIEGKLALHGVTKTRQSTGNITIAKTKFQISIKDYNTEIPTSAIKNISEVVDVTVNYLLHLK